MGAGESAKTATAHAILAGDSPFVPDAPAAVLALISVDSFRV